MPAVLKPKTQMLGMDGLSTWDSTAPNRLRARGRFKGGRSLQPRHPTRLMRIGRKAALPEGAAPYAKVRRTSPRVHKERTRLVDVDHTLPLLSLRQ